MTASLRPFLDRWRLCALLVSAAMLAIAHAFESFGGFAPCALCLRQREVYWGVGGLALALMVAVRLPGGARLREASCWLLALAFIVSVGVAAYHAGVEWRFWPGPTTGAGGGIAGGVDAASMSALLQGARIRPPACDEPAWVFLGLSMAGWNVMISLALTALSIAAARRERSKG